MSATPWWPAEPSAPESRLALLGWDDLTAQHFAPHARAGLRPARVARVDRGVCTLLAADDSHRAGVASRGLQPAIGDWVAFRPATGQSQAVVLELLPRRTRFARRAAGEQTAEQVVAANVDTVLLVNGLDQRISPRRIERYLTLTWQSGATPAIVFAKADLCHDPEPVIAGVRQIALGTPIHVVSAVTGSGLGELDRYRRDNGTIALLGPSGAGKSTLVNRLLGDERLRTGELRSDGRGRHTTSHRALMPLPGGGVLIDTPGMRTVGLWEGGEALDQTFAEIDRLAAACRFADCDHESEPGCAVKAALAAGTLSEERLASYRKLQREIHYEQAQRDARARADERRRGRAARAARKAPPHEPPAR